MKLITPEPQIDIGNVGFKGNCVLGRAEDGKKLSELIEKVEDPIVIAIDGSWGSGKTHFLKLWAGAHTIENGGTAKIIYFDAFKNDYLDDPLVALISEISSRFESDKKSKKAITLLKQAGAKLAMPVLRVGLAVTTVGASEIVGAVGDAALSASGKEIKDQINSLWKKEADRRTAVRQFSDILQKLTQPDNKGEPPKKLVIIIDELDRCRPDYALNLLEISKHFFAVPNVHFVLGANLSELGKSVRSRYGSDIDASRYLQKFIHVALKLTENPTRLNNEHVTTLYFKKIAAVHGLGNSQYCNILEAYIKRKNFSGLLSLRDVERLCTLAVLAPPNDNVWGGIYQPVIVAGLLIIRLLDPTLIEKANAGKLTLENIQDFFRFNSKIQRPELHYEKTISNIWKFVLDQSIEIPDEDRGKILFDTSMGDTHRSEILPHLIRTHVDGYRIYGG